MITPSALICQLPVTELQESLETFLEPLTEQLPDARLLAVVHLMVQGIVASESPLITQIARGTREPEHSVLMTSKRGYRLLANKRLSHRLFLKGLYGIAQRTVARQASLSCGGGGKTEDHSDRCLFGAFKHPPEHHERLFSPQAASAF